MILEMLPQLFDLDRWIASRKALHEQIKTLPAGQMVIVHSHEFVPRIPPVLHSPTTRLLLLGDSAGIGAVQLREFLEMLVRGPHPNWAVPARLTGPNPVIPGHILGAFAVIQRNAALSQKLYGEIDQMHKAIKDEYQSLYRSGAREPGKPEGSSS